MDVGAQCLNPGPVRGRSTGLPAAADEDARSLLVRNPQRLLRETALADSRLADEEEDPTVAAACLIHRSAQCAYLAVTTYKATRSGLGC